MASVNGFVIARLKINALITTLATMQIVRGPAYIISDGKAVGIEDERFFTLGYANWFGLPAPIWLTVACPGGFRIITKQNHLWP